MSNDTDECVATKTSDGRLDNQDVTGGALSVASGIDAPHGSAGTPAEPPRLESSATHSLNELGRVAHAMARSKGFYDPEPSIPERLCLIHSEISEALEAYRDDEIAMRLEANGKPEGMVTELADAVIRIVDLCAYLGLDLDHVIQLKMTYNAGRPFKHGRARL